LGIAQVVGRTLRSAAAEIELSPITIVLDSLISFPQSITGADRQRKIFERFGRRSNVTWFSLQKRHEFL
jgi:hypothetical protein